MSRVIRSSAFSLAFGYIALGAVALVLFAAPLWYAWQVTIQDGRAEILKEDAQRLTEVYRRGGIQQLTEFINTRVNLQIAGERILMLTDSSLHPIAGNLPVWPSNIPKEPGVYTIAINLEGQPTQAVFVRAALPNGYSLLVGRDLARYVPFETRFWYGLIGALAVLSIVGAIGGFLIRRALLSRVDGIRQTASAIVQGNLSHRLAVRHSGDELDTLSLTFNRMLDQIEQLVHGVRDVSNAIAHDLRTPLAELRSRLEELVLIRPSADQTFSEIEAAVADVDRVISIFNALLRLAEINAGVRRSGFVQIDIARVTAEVVEFYQPAAELKDITLSFQPVEPILASCDPLLLSQAIGNLIDNAMKYSHAGGNIQVDLFQWEDKTIEVRVSDNGPGISAVEKSKVIERFYRGDTGRSTPGVGLGLTLVDAVARLHHGSLVLADNSPGLRVSILIKTNLQPMFL